MLSDVEAAVEEAEVAELLLSLPLCHAASSSLLPPVPSVHELVALRSAAGSSLSMKASGARSMRPRCGFEGRGTLTRTAAGCADSPANATKARHEEPALHVDFFATDRSAVGGRTGARVLPLSRLLF